MWRVCLQCGRPGFDPWVWTIPWRSEWLPTPVLLPGGFRGQWSLVDYTPWGHKESDTTERLTLSLPVAVRDKTEAFHCLMILSELWWSLCLQSSWTCGPSVTASLKLSSLRPSYWGFLFPPPPHIFCDGLLPLPSPARFPRDPLSLGRVSEARRWACCHSPGFPAGVRARLSLQCDSGELVTPDPRLPLCHRGTDGMRGMNGEDAPRRPFRVKTGSTPRTCSADHPLCGLPKPPCCAAPLLRSQDPSLLASSLPTGTKTLWGRGHAVHIQHPPLVLNKRVW